MIIAAASFSVALCWLISAASGNNIILGGMRKTPVACWTESISSELYLFTSDG